MALKFLLVPLEPLHQKTVILNGIRKVTEKKYPNVYTSIIGVKKVEVDQKRLHVQCHIYGPDASS